MRTCSRFPSLTKRSLALCLITALSTSAQTLARPGWAGSGLTAEPWWRHAVLYRLDDAKLPTLTALPSFQAFGIDALLLTPQAMQQSTDIPAAAPEGSDPADQPLTLDDLLFECSRLRIRVLVPLDVSTDRDNVMALARSWLYRGAAGFVLTGLDKLPKPSTTTPAPTPSPDATPGPIHLRRGTPRTLHLANTAEPQILTDLHKLVAQSVGDRLLIASATADAPLSYPSVQLQIVSLGPDPSTHPSISARLASLSTAASPRALLALDPTSTAAMNPINATLLLATDQPAILDSSRLSFDMLAKVFPPLAKAIAPDAPAAAAPAPPPPPPQNEYGAFHEYVRKPDNAAAERKRKAAADKAAAEATDIAFATFPIQPMYQAMSNTPEGLVAFYHRLIQLHRSNRTLREGTLFALHAEPSQSIAYAALHNGSAPLIVVLNTSDTAQHFNIAADLRKLHMNRNSSRTLLHTGPASALQDDDKIGVPAHGVYVGELARGYAYK